MVTAVAAASIAQRLDRLPLTWTLWRLALVTQAGWALVVATDAIAARIYPFVWGPEHAFDTTRFSLLLVISTGVGIVAGEYLFSVLADRFGRRRMLLAAAATCGLGTLPAAFTNSFALLTLSLGLGAVGIGGVLATNIVYMAELAPNEVRGRMTQTSQAFAVFLLAVLASLPAIFLMPGHYQAYVALMAAGPLLVLVPLVAFVLPESPRWLDAHGQRQKADEVVSRLERESEARAGKLPPQLVADVAPHTRATVRDLLGREYRGRTVLLLVCWLLGYSGLIYGTIGFQNLYLARVGFPAQSIFIAGLIASVLGGAAGLLFAGRLNERFERRFLILAGAVLASAGLCLVLGTGWTDGFGHVGSIVSPLIVGALFTATASADYIGFFAYVIIPGALLPGLLLARFGIDHRAAPLETVTGV